MMSVCHIQCNRGDPLLRGLHGRWFTAGKIPTGGHLAPLNLDK